MVRLTRINHKPLVLNSDLIEHLEATPDTVISLTNGQKFMVLESSDEIIDRIIEFRRAIFHSGFHSYCRPASEMNEPGDGV